TRPPPSTLLPYTTLFRSGGEGRPHGRHAVVAPADGHPAVAARVFPALPDPVGVVTSDDLVHHAPDRPLPGSLPRLDGGEIGVDRLLLDAVQDRGIDGAHLTGEQLGGPLVQTAGGQGRQDRGVALGEVHREGDHGRG